MSLYKEKIKNNIAISHKATRASRIKKEGLTNKPSKLSSKNFEKLMKTRGLSKQESENLKSSMSKKTFMQVRHAKAGEKFLTTHGTENSSGIFVSKNSLGKSANERINKGALPHSNTADYETKVVLAKDQNLVYGKIAPQSKFSKMDPKQLSRSGGGEQVITDGGYKSGAITNNDSKYPIEVKSDFQKRSMEYKKSKNCNKVNRTALSRTNNKSKGQAR